MDGKASPLFEFDKALANASPPETSRSFLIGIDEAGRGPWAGPVVASAVILPAGFYDPALNDSKKLTAVQRERLYARIETQAFHATAVVEPESIDALNILQATLLAMKTAFALLRRKHPALVPGLVVVDGNRAPHFGCPHKTVVRGDSRSACVAAASVVAKVGRDEIMRGLDRIYPQYGFARHKGYGTSLHRETLTRFGPCPAHRRSFSPVRNWAQVP